MGRHLQYERRQQNVEYVNAVLSALHTQVVALRHLGYGVAAAAAAAAGMLLRQAAGMVETLAPLEIGKAAISQQLPGLQLQLQPHLHSQDLGQRFLHCRFRLDSSVLGM